MKRKRSPSFFNPLRLNLTAERYVEALSDYDEILNYKPYNLDALRGKSAVLFKLKRYAKAITIFDKILSR